MAAMIDPMLAIFIGLIALSSFIAIYFVTTKVSFRRKQVAEAKMLAEEETGTQIPEEVIEKVIERGEERKAEKELVKIEQKEKIKRIKKANRGLLKLKKKLVIYFHNKSGIPPQIYELGKAHSYDRIGLDGKEDKFVIYYYPKHNSVFLNGLQALIAIFGRGRKRIQVPIGAIEIGDEMTLIHADFLKTIAPNTIEVIPPEDIRVDIDLYTAYRDRYETILNLWEQTLEDINKPFKKVLSYRGGGYFFDRFGIPEDEFRPFRVDEPTPEGFVDSWNRLKQMKRELGED